MTTDARHSKQTSTNGGVHTIVAFIYANETARLAATGFVPGDVGKVALDQDTNELNWLVDDDPITWATFDAGAAAQLNKVEVNCRKASAGTINRGQVVYATGYDDTNGYALVELAQANSASTLPIVGVIDETCTDSSTGQVMVVGVLGNVDTSSFSAQNPLYLSATTAGAFTNVAPDGPAIVQSLGVVLKSDATTGQIGVNILGFRSIEYTDDPLIAGAASAGTSNTSSASDHVHPTELIDQANVLYVGKHGNDTNDGKTSQAAFLTFGAALAEALSQTPSAFNPFNIMCHDAGGYTEDITIYSYCVVTAPAATLIGEIILQDYAGGEFLQIRVGAGETAVSKTTGTETSSIKASGIDAAGSGNAIKNDGTDSVVIAELDYINVEDGDAIHDNSSGSGHIHVWAGDIYINGDGRGLVTAGGEGKIYADIQEIEDHGAGTTTAIEVQTGKIRCNVQHIDCDTAWDVASGATLEAFIGSSSGTTTETGTVNVSIAGEATGETNTASNVGTAGVGVFKQKSDVDLEFKKINAGSAKVTVTDDTGNDEVDINVVTGTDANSVCVGNDSRLSDSRAPTSHASSHDAGGGDAMAIDAVAGTGSLRTLGTSATSACAGNDSRLSDSRTPTSHATSHQNGGGDEISVAGLSGLLADGQTPLSHASTHDAGGGDAMAIDAVAGTGSLRTLGTSATSACAGDDSRLSDSRTPTSHSTSHENGGGDEISVAGLSGLLADGQTPLSHATSHQSGGADAIKLDDLASPDDNTDLDSTTSAHGLLPKLSGGTTNYLRADGTWAEPSGGSGEANTASNVGTAGVGVFKQKSDVDLEFKKINAGSAKVTVTDDTGNDEVDINVVTGTDANSVCVGNDSRLSDSRAPTSHASSHDAGGGDAMAIDAVAGTGSLRTLGTSATSACAGNDSRLSDNRTDADAIHDNVAGEIAAITAKGTPTTSDYLVIEDAADSNNKKSITVGDLPASAPASHASSHNAGGGDALAIDAAAGTGSLRTLGTASTAACAGDDSRLSDSRAPTSHASTHDAGGGDAMAIDAVAGTGSLRTLGTSATSACAGDDSRLSDSRTPTSHSTSHENGGGDEISVAGLSGLLADGQTPLSHATSHQSGGADAIKLDDLASPDDNTDLDATTSAHGLLPKLAGGTTNYLRADGNWSAPATESSAHLSVSVRKASSGTITAGQVVYLVGWDAGGEVPTVELADASTTGTMPAFGVASESITNLATGALIVSGELTGQDTSIWSAGDELYVSETAGDLTTTKPTGTALVQKFAEVTRDHPTMGVIQVFGAGRINDLPNLPENKVWMGNASAVPTETAVSSLGSQIKLDDLGAPDDNTDLDSTTSAHGLLPKLGGGTTNYLRADGTWAEPSGGSGEANTASNVGTAGVGVFKQKSDVDLEFKKINAGSSKITITDDTGNDEVDINVVTGTDANSVCIGNDSRLSDSRTPTSHASTHQSGGGDAIKIDDLAAADDNTDLNATTSVHGLLPKLGGGTTNYLRADGTWAAPAGGGGSGDDAKQFFADQLDTPVTSDWPVTTRAAGNKDSNNTGLAVRRFDDTTEEGVGFILEIPTGVTDIIIEFRSRAETSAASNLNVVPKLYYREIPDNAAVESWGNSTMTAITMGTSNEYFQYDSQTIALSTLSLVAGRVAQFELTRDAGAAGDTLVGDWSLLMVKVSFS